MTIKLKVVEIFLAYAGGHITKLEYQEIMEEINERYQREQIQRMRTLYY